MHILNFKLSISLHYDAKKVLRPITLKPNIYTYKKEAFNIGGYELYQNSRNIYRIVAVKSLRK